MNTSSRVLDEHSDGSEITQMLGWAARWGCRTEEEENAVKGGTRNHGRSGPDPQGGCYRRNICAPLPIDLLKSNPQRDAVSRWGIGEVVES